MKFGFVVPWADAAEIGELAAVAELHGWDGLFVWEPVWGVDAWVALAVAACRTKKLRVGTMLTPLPRRKPWELAGQVATVDRLSKGRVIVSVGLGAPDSGYDAFGEETDKVVRGELLDEGLDILRGLWSGQPFKHHGKHYTIEPSEFPAIGHTTQKPGVPIWCVGALGSNKSMTRALACDGLIPQVVENGQRTPMHAPGAPEVGVTGSTVRCHRRRRGQRTFACGVGKGRCDLVAGDTVERGQRSRCARLLHEPAAAGTTSRVAQLSRTMARFAHGPPAKPPIESAPVTVRHGHFWVGADPDPDTGVARGPMYVYWEAPAEVTKPYPIVLVHGGGGQGLDYLATPDGRPGWSTLLSQQGWVVYVVDRPGHGRSAYSPDVLGPMAPPLPVPVLRSIFVPPAEMPFADQHTQWPGDRNDPADPAWLQFLAASGPFAADAADRQALEQQRLVELLDRIGPAFVVSNSLGGPAGFLVGRCSARPRRWARATRADRSGIRDHVRPGHVAMGCRRCADGASIRLSRRPASSASTRTSRRLPARPHSCCRTSPPDN